MDNRPALSVVIPAYNEAQRIGDSLCHILEYLRGIGCGGFEILVVDDGSRDSTRAQVEEVARANSEVRLLAYDHNRGKGYAVRLGMLAATGNRVLLSDADLSTPIEDLPILEDALDSGADIAVGSRAVRGSVRTVHQPRYRELGGKLLNAAIRLLAVPGIYDTQCGFKLFRGEAARRIFSKCVLNGFSFDVEALYVARLMGYCLAEVPVHWAHREGSKVRPFLDGFRILRDVAGLRLRKYSLDG